MKKNSKRKLLNMNSNFRGTISTKQLGILWVDFLINKNKENYRKRKKMQQLKKLIVYKKSKVKIKKKHKKSLKI